MSESSISFCRSIDQWSLAGGNLEEVLSVYEGHTISTSAEVEAICRALDSLHANYQALVGTDDRPLGLLASYLFSPCNAEVLESIVSGALPLLRWYVTDALSKKPYEPADLLKVLQLLAMFRQKEDISLIFKSILFPVEPEDEAWFEILASFRDKHPYLRPFLQALAQRPPSGQAGLAFQNLCDHVVLTKQLLPHAFNSEAGMKHLRGYLQPSGQTLPQYARAAVQSAAFLEKENRESLFDLASQHPDEAIVFLVNVTQAKLGDTSQEDVLRERCADVCLSYETQLKLREIGMEALIPQEAVEPEFLACAKTAHWLIHESPYRRAPDRMRVVDERELFWLPQHQPVYLYAVIYEYDQPQGESGLTDGIAVVGGITCSLIDETNAKMDLADVYGLHCCWELEQLNDPVAPRHRTPKIGRNLLRKNNPDF